MPCKHPRGIHVVCVRTIHPTQWLHLASYLGKSLQLATVAKLYKSPAYHISTHLSISQAILVIPLSSSTCSPRSVATVNDRTHLPKAGSLATMTTADYTDAWNIPMEKDGWVRAHHTIREDLKDIERMGVAFVGQLKAGKPLSKSQIAAAKRFWGVYYVFLAHHHATEDSIVLPHLQKYTDMPQQLCLDHELIIGATNKLNSMLHEALDNPDGVAASDIEVFLKELKDTSPLLLSHLDEEEKELIPLFRRHVSPKEAKKIVDQIIRSLPFAATSNFIDKMNSPQDFAEFSRQEGIPFFVVWILKWQHKRYVRRVKTPFERAIQEAIAASKIDTLKE